MSSTSQKYPSTTWLICLLVNGNNGLEYLPETDNEYLFYFTESTNMILRIFAILFVLPIVSFSQMHYSMDTKMDVDKIVELYNRHGEVTAEMRRVYPINNLGGQEYVSFLAKAKASFSAREMRSRGVNIGTQINDIVTMRYPLGSLSEVFSEVGLSYLKIAAKIKPLLDRVKTGTRVDSVWKGINLPQAYTGKNVIIGINDLGFDYVHLPICIYLHYLQYAKKQKIL